MSGIDFDEFLEDVPRERLIGRGWQWTRRWDLAVADRGCGERADDQD